MANPIAHNPEDRYDSLFQYYGNKYAINWLLLKAQVQAESGFDPDAVSKVGAVGLAQFMQRTWDEWRDGTAGVQESPPNSALDPRDPEDAIRAQAAYLAWLLRAFGGDVMAALAAYNWGIGRVREARAHWAPDEWIWRAPRETRDYVKRILGSTILSTINGRLAP